jgi:hypothetical protein
VRGVLAQHGVTADIRCDRWNPISKSWTSHEDLMNAERRKSAATGWAVWQVRAGSWSHHDLKVLAQRLEAERLSIALRWNYLIAGASCEEEAQALAEQIRGCSSAGTRVRVQPSVYDRPPVRVWVSQHGRIWVLKPMVSGAPIEAATARTTAGSG